MTRKTPRAKQQDVITLTDLAPRQRVVGGSQRRVFGSDAPANRSENQSARKATKDLPVKTAAVKGGKLAGNDNLTLVRAARPATKDLPAKATVKGGKLGANDNLTLVRVAKAL
jgi:hypothetical protein